MLKLFLDIYVKFVVKMALLFIVFYIAVLFLISLDLEKRTLCFLLFTLFFTLFLLLIYMLKKVHRRLNEDIEALSFYLKKIDAKEYDAEIKITNYLDFLEISLVLKNIVKRLAQKEKRFFKK